MICDDILGQLMADMSIPYGTHNVDAIHDGASLAALRVDFEIEVFGDTSSRRSIHADGVHLVQECDGAVFVGQIANLLNGSNRAAHRVDRLEGDNLGRVEG